MHSRLAKQIGYNKLSSQNYNEFSNDMQNVTKPLEYEQARQNDSTKHHLTDQTKNTEHTKHRYNLYSGQASMELSKNDNSKQTEYRNYIDCSKDLSRHSWDPVNLTQQSKPQRVFPQEMLESSEDVQDLVDQHILNF